MTAPLTALAPSTPEYTAHLLADRFPRMADTDYAELKASIHAQGLLQPIVLFEGQILDGRHRYQACRELDLPLDTEEYTGDDPTGYVWSANAARRQLTPGQIACVAVEMFPAVEEITRQRQRAGKRRNEGDDLGEFVPQGQRGRTYLAALCGANERYLSIAKRLKVAAPDLFTQAWTGAMTLPRAEKAWKEREGQTPRLHRQKHPVAVAACEDTVGQDDRAAIGHDSTQYAGAPSPSSHTTSDAASPRLAAAITTALAAMAAAIGGIDVPERVLEDTLVAHQGGEVQPDHRADDLEWLGDEEMIAAPQLLPVDPLDILPVVFPPRDVTDVAIMVRMMSASGNIDLDAVILALFQTLDRAGRDRVVATLAPASLSMCASGSQRADGTLDRGVPVENPPKQQAIALAHALRARGVSHAQIAGALNAHNFPTVRGNAWTRRRVGELLQHSEAPILSAHAQERLEGWVRAALEGGEPIDTGRTPLPGDTPAPSMAP